MGGDGRLACECVSWLGKIASVSWCMELDFFSLERNGVSSNDF